VSVTGESIRYSIDPRDVPPTKAARRLHLTLAEFITALPNLYRRGFPRPDLTTGNFDLVAIDRWMDGRHLSTAPDKARDARDVMAERLKD
jgi:hypothetical protein